MNAPRPSFPPEPTRAAHVDWTAWPIIVITYPNIASVEGVERMFAEVRERPRDEPFAIVGDLRPLRVSTANAKVRAAFAEQVALDTSGTLAAESAVVSSTLARGLVTAYRWLAPAPHPSAVFQSVGEATRWSREILEGGS